jgi:hypothetical protein
VNEINSVLRSKKDEMLEKRVGSTAAAAATAAMR